jgi:creatinine amidohydrolase
MRGSVVAGAVMLGGLACSPSAEVATKGQAPAGPLTGTTTATAETARGARAGVMLEDLTWMEAEAALTEEAVVVLPIGAAAKEHGPHLLLKNDLLLAEYFRDRLVERAKVVMAPVLPYHFYPAFVEYPGSTSLRLETARDVVVDICRSLARFGPRRFYALNTGVSTVRALAPAAEVLAAEGILLRYTVLRDAMGEAVDEVRQQEGGSHADEIETSMMLVIAPETVRMEKAVKDYDAVGKGRLSREKSATAETTYSPSGIWGDATLATREKGERVVRALVEGLVADVEATRAAALPLAGAPPSRTTP